MDQEERNTRSKGYTNFRGAMHLGIGGLYMAIGVAVMYFKAFGAVELGTGIAYALGAVLVLFGGFRMWRGWMQLKEGK